TRKKASSLAHAIWKPVSPPNKKPRRASSHKMHTAARPLPFSGLEPVQVALAVKRKPTAIVAIKPHSISWACQATPARGCPSHCGAKIHKAIAINAQPQPAIYSGRKPRLRKAVISGRVLAGL